jgi:reactive intermediate/imine deaminase
MKQVIGTQAAPQAIGTYSQAVKTGNTVYLSGQIPLVAETMTVVDGDFKAQVRQVFENLSAVAEAAGGHLSNIVKVMIYLTDMETYSDVNEIMADYFEAPYPARAVVAVAALPKGVAIEVDAILVLGE